MMVPAQRQTTMNTDFWYTSTISLCSSHDKHAFTQQNVKDDRNFTEYILLSFFLGSLCNNLFMPLGVVAMPFHAIFYHYLHI